jgi:membrane fusion protein, multidrug efflux system
VRSVLHRGKFAIAGLAVLALLAGCVGDDASKKKKSSPPLVKARPVERHRFVDMIDAVGTAKANEQVTIASSVTERVERVLFDDGMAVRKGQLLAVLSQGQEDASLRGALAAERQAAAQYQRVRAIADRGFATKAQLDVQLAAMESARAAAAEAQAQIGDRMIRAPFAGHTGLRNISPGAVISAGMPLVTVSDISRIKLDFTVPETGLSGLRSGQPIEAVAAAFPGEVFEGRISTIDPVIDPSSRAVLIRAILPNPGARLKPGMLLSVKVRLAERVSDAVPELAVTGDGAARFVYVLGPGNKAKQVEIRTGLRDAGLIEVQGVPPRSKVIVEGVVKVVDGMKVKLAKPAGRKGKRG